MLHPLYTGVSADYDAVNSLITLRLDAIWRECCARECAAGKTVLDLCCGTGGLISKISKELPEGSVAIGLDFNAAMLKKAQLGTLSGGKQALAEDAIGRKNNISGFILADASHLPLRDGCIDRIGISFAVRNLLYQNPKAEAYFKEILRVLGSGGAFVCLETGQPSNPLFRTILHLYFKNVVPLVGWLVSGKSGIYTFLGKSAAEFPSPREIASFFLKEGFRNVSFKPLNQGAATLYVALK